MTWDIYETLALVEAKYGKHQRELAKASIQSACQRLRYAHFHYWEVKDLLEQFKTETLNKHRLLWVVWGPDDAVRTEYFEFMDKIGAHAVACVQSIHAIADLIACSVFRCLVLDAGRTSVPEHKVDCAMVQTALSKDNRFQSIRLDLEALTADSAFLHVAALTNKAKHSSIVETLLNEDMTGERSERYEIRFAAFERKCVHYPQATLGDVLAPACDLGSKTIVDIGNGLTKILK